MRRGCIGVTLLMSFLLAPLCVAEELFAFQSYRQGVLRMTLVSNSIEGELLARQGDQLERIGGAVLEQLFTLRVALSCDFLNEEREFAWFVPGRPPLRARVPAQTCGDEPQADPLFPPVTIGTRQGVCMIDTGGNTLWRVASELAARNGASVHQNLYATFLVNKGAFVADDIHRLRSRQLRCPSVELVRSIDPAQARRLFHETLTLR